jgi:hypothetical protein
MIVQSAAAAARGSSNAPQLHRPQLSRVLFLRRSEMKSFLRNSCSCLPIFHKNALFCRRQKKEDSDKNVPEKEYRNVVIYARTGCHGTPPTH